MSTNPTDTSAKIATMMAHAAEAAEPVNLGKAADFKNVKFLGTPRMASFELAGAKAYETRDYVVEHNGQQWFTIEIYFRITQKIRHTDEIIVDADGFPARTQRTLRGIYRWENGKFSCAFGTYNKGVFVRSFPPNPRGEELETLFYSMTSDERREIARAAALTEAARKTSSEAEPAAKRDLNTLPIDSDEETTAGE